MPITSVVKGNFRNTTTRQQMNRIMNHFSEKFDNRIRTFWNDNIETEKQRLLDDILQYANANSQTFKRDIAEIQFDKDLEPLPIILEALSKDTTNWGQFYVDLLDDIFDTAKQTEKPNKILRNLIDYAYIEKDDKPFIQKIVDRLYKELDNDNLDAKLAAIWTLPNFLDNKIVKNRNKIIDTLQRLLNDNNWKVRIVAFKSLEYENLLPERYSLSFKDKLLKFIFGEPEQI